MSNLLGWHRGERVVRKTLGYDKIPGLAHGYTWISGEMPDEHTKFYTNRLQFLPICTLDEDGRPWGSILVGKDGERGFVRHPRYSTLTIDTQLSEGDPLLKNSTRHSHGHQMLVAGIGVELSTRRRNKFAGEVTKLSLEGYQAVIELIVNEAIGNCPKYITLRELEPIVGQKAHILHDELHLSTDKRLPQEAVALITVSDIVFFGTTYAAASSENKTYPMNHRGGAPGFVRIKSDGRTLILPDFSGNRIMTSLGNVEATPLAGVTFVSFTTGDVLYVTGNAQNLYGDDAENVMPFQRTLTEIFVTGYVYVRHAFPFREKPGQERKLSPYNPPLRLLRDEIPSSRLFSSKELPLLLLTGISLHSPTVATFDWQVSAPVRIQPGQSTILDFKPLFGARQYQHMSPVKPSLVNDDFIRTWTVSSASGAADAPVTSFSLTMREKPGGVVTGALFNFARTLADTKPEVLADAKGFQISVNLVGFSGDFVLPKTISWPTSPQHILWIAGGIGVTPFLAMIHHLALQGHNPSGSLTLVLAAKDPNIMLALVSDALRTTGELPFNLSIHLFTSYNHLLITSVGHGTHLSKHYGRINGAGMEGVLQEVPPGELEAFICGPDSFAASVRTLLTSSGALICKIHHEGFAY